MSDRPKLSLVATTKTNVLVRFIASREDIERCTGIRLDDSTQRLKGKGLNTNENRAIRSRH